MKILFNASFDSVDTNIHIEDVLHYSGLGAEKYTKKALELLTEIFNSKKTLLTHSCTAALEMAAILIDIQPGDEVIMPSYTFVSTANAFVLRGATPVFVDIREDTLNIDETKIEAAITDKTKAIVPVHYAGVCCNMDVIMKIADEKNLYVIEDAAQCIGTKYQGKHPGTLGHFGTFSFHYTKNITSGLGGALLINDEKFSDRAKVISQKGTNREAFIEGQVDKYTWMDVGSSFMMSELSAALLTSQLEQVDKITQKRLKIWNQYFQGLSTLSANGAIRLPSMPNDCKHNAHIFYVICQSLEIRNKLMRHLKEHDIQSTFHYIPLHSSPAGKKFSRISGELTNTTELSERIIRLPLHCGLGTSDVDLVINTIIEFYI